MGVLALLAFGASVVAALSSHVFGRRSRARAWMESARAAGWEALTMHTRAGWPVRVEGRRGSLSLRIRTFHDTEANRAGTRIEVHGLTDEIALKASAPDDRDDVLLGDEAFDPVIHVRGDERVAAALLDAPTREMVRDLFAQRVGREKRERVIDMGARLDPGCLVAQRTLGNKPVWLAGYLTELLELAERLQEPADVVGRMLANLRGDPCAGVRRANLRLLLQRPTSPDERRAAIALGLEDASDHVKLDAALAAGDEGRAALLEIATREPVDDACAARAVTELGPKLPTEAALAALARAVEASRARTAAACLETLGGRGPEQAEVIGRALESVSGPVAVAAARALARVGSAASVLLLREAEARQPRDRELRQAVADAVTAIRARLVGADEGQVSIPDEEAGRVSMASAQAGRVSLPPAADGTE